MFIYFDVYVFVFIWNETNAEEISIVYSVLIPTCLTWNNEEAENIQNFPGLACIPWGQAQKFHC